MEKVDQSFRVIHVYSGYCTKKGGIKRVLGELLREQNRLNDMQAWVYATKERQLIGESGESQQAGLGDLLAHKPNLVIFHSLYSDLVGFYRLSKLLRRARIPYCIEPHGNLDRRAMEKSGLKKRIANSIWVDSWVKKAKGVIYLCEEERDASRLPQLDHAILPNAFPEPLMLAETLTEINEPIKLMMLSRIDPFHKGIDRFLETIRQWPEETASSIEVEIFGYGSDKSIQWLKEELASINQVKVAFRGPVFGQDKKRALKNADIFCMFSRYEGLPLALYEAAASGLPVLVTEGSNRTEWVQANGNGWVLWDEDESEWGERLAAVVAEYANDPKTYKRNAIRAARNLPTWEEIAKDSVRVYRKWGIKHDE